MFSWCGKLVSRWPIGTVLAWMIVSILVFIFAPPMSDVAKDGEFDFLPKNSDSRVAERTYRLAFPYPAPHEEVENAKPPLPGDAAGGGQEDGSPAKEHQARMDPLGCSVVIVLQRSDVRGGLTIKDEEFVTNSLVPGLEQIQERTPAGQKLLPLDLAQHPIPQKDRIIRGIWTFEDDRIGPLLRSEDGHATLVLVELTAQFLNRGNKLVVSRIEDLLKSKEVQNALPVGLDVNLSGCAATVASYDLSGVIPSRKMFDSSQFSSWPRRRPPKQADDCL